MQDHVSRLIGLDGFKVRDVIEDGDQLDLEVELVARAERCPHCQSNELVVHERPVVAVRDLPCAGRRVLLRWRKRRYRCKGCRHTHTESCEQAPVRQRLTRRFREHLTERARSGGAHAEIAREERTSRYQVGRAMRVAATQSPGAEPAPLPRRLSLDEASRRKGYGNLATIVSDLDAKRVHDVLDGRSRRTLEGFLDSLGPAQRDRVESVCIDLWEPYRKALRGKLPQATIVADPFHVVRGAGEALDAVRRSRQREQRGPAKPRGRRGRGPSWSQGPYRARHLLLRGAERLKDTQRARLGELFAHDPVLAEAWRLKEALRSVYLASDRREAELRLDRFFAAVERSGLQPFHSYVKGIAPWREEILAYFDRPASNGYAEGVINKVKLIKRRAYGLPRFESFRERVLVACG